MSLLIRKILNILTLSCMLFSFNASANHGFTIIITEEISIDTRFDGGRFSGIYDFSLISSYISLDEKGHRILGVEYIVNRIDNEERDIVEYFVMETREKDVVDLFLEYSERSLSEIEEERTIFNPKLSNLNKFMDEGDARLIVDTNGMPKLQFMGCVVRRNEDGSLRSTYGCEDIDVSSFEVRYIEQTHID